MQTRTPMVTRVFVALVGVVVWTGALQLAWWTYGLLGWRGLLVGPFLALAIAVGLFIGGVIIWTAVFRADRLSDAGGSS